MKQSQSFKVGIYLQIQLHHQRIKAQCCSWGKTAWTGHTLSWQAEPPFFLTRSPSNSKLFPPECWWLQRRGIFLASLQNLGNCGLLGLHLPSSRAGCKQTIINCKYWVFRSLTCSAQRQVHLLHQESHQTHQGPAVSSWARRTAVVLPIGSDFLRLLEWVPIFDLPNKWWLSTTNYYPSEITAQFVTSLSCSLL